MELIVVALALGIAVGLGAVFVRCLEADAPWSRDMAKAMLLLNGVHVPADPVRRDEAVDAASIAGEDDSSNDSERLAA